MTRVEILSGSGCQQCIATDRRFGKKAPHLGSVKRQITDAEMEHYRSLGATGLPIVEVWGVKFDTAALPDGLHKGAQDDMIWWSGLNFGFVDALAKITA